MSFCLLSFRWSLTHTSLHLCIVPTLSSVAIFWLVLVQTCHDVPQTNYNYLIFRHQLNQTSFLPKHKYAYMQTAVIKLTSDSQLQRFHKQNSLWIICIAAYAYYCPLFWSGYIILNPIICASIFWQDGRAPINTSGPFVICIGNA